MIKVYQDLTVANNGRGNCFNACVASLLEKRLEDTNHILPRDGGDWHERWRLYFADLGYKLEIYFPDCEDIPTGYSITSVFTNRTYPEDHIHAGSKIHHAVIMFNQQLVHDPYPLGSEITRIHYHQFLVPLTEVEKEFHKIRYQTESDE